MFIFNMFRKYLFIFLLIIKKIEVYENFGNRGMWFIRPTSMNNVHRRNSLVLQFLNCEHEAQDM